MRIIFASHQAFKMTVVRRISNSISQWREEPSRIVRAGFWLLGALSFVRIAIVAGGSVAGDVNSDALFLPDVLRDLFVFHAPISSWVTQPALSIFPDALAMGISLLAFPHSIGAAFFTYFALFAVGFVAVFARCLRNFGVPRNTAWSLSMAANAVALFFSIDSAVLRNLYLPGHHGAALPVALFVLSELVASQNNRRLTARQSIVVGCVVFLICASDKIFLLQGSLPLLAVIALHWMRGLMPARIAFRWILLLVLATGCGFFFERALVSFLGIFVPKTDANVDLSWTRVFDGIGHLRMFWVQESTLAWVFAAFLLLAPFAQRIPTHRRTRGSNLMQVFFFASVVVNFAGVIFGGYLTDPFRIRYLDTWYTWPCMAAAAWLCSWSPFGEKTKAFTAENSFKTIGAGLLAAAMIFLQTHLPENPRTERALQSYPREVRCLDRLASEHHAQYGYAAYWQARRFTFQSHQPLRVVAVDEGFGVYEWIVNLFWHQEIAHRTGPLLVWTQSIRTSSVQSQLGLPDVQTNCDTSTGESVPVWIYKNAPAHRLNGNYEHR